MKVEICGFNKNVTPDEVESHIGPLDGYAIKAPCPLTYRWVLFYEQRK